MGDLGDNEIVLKVAKPRSQKQIETFEKARAIRLENSILKKEGIEKVKSDVKNRNKVGELKVNTVAVLAPTTPSLSEPKPLALPSDRRAAPLEPNIARGHRGTAVPLDEDEPEIVIVKKKKKPKVIYIDGSSDDEPEPIRVKKEKVNIPKEPSTTQSGLMEQIIKEKEPLVIIHKPSIRFC